MSEPASIAAGGGERVALDARSVEDAAARLLGVAHRTPVTTSRTLDGRVGAAVHLKCENFQRAGSFKFRGAYNAVASIPSDRRALGVLTYSSGNHGQAIALAGCLLDTAVTVVMPANAPAVKREAAAGYGAEIVFYDPTTETREEVAARLQEERGATLIPPFDHPDVIAGQGTAARELFEDAGPLDLLLVPCGGGGLLSGSAITAAARGGCRVIGVEPELADDAARTFRTGSLQSVSNPATIADGLRTPSLGAITWPIIRREVSDMITVTDAEIVDAMRFLWARMKLVVEPSGAVAVAALFRYGAIGGSRVGVILSGGNMDLAEACGLFGGNMSGRSDRGLE